MTQNSNHIYNLPLQEIDDFPDHPYHVRLDEEMDNLTQSIAQNGVITPIIVRPKEDGRYEIISGHRRKKACELAGLPTIKSRVIPLTRDQAMILMVESNYQRDSILPSEKAFAYQMHLDATKRQGQRTDLTSSPLETKLRSSEILAQKAGESRAQIDRYIRLTKLIPPLLDLVDERKIALRPAVELSYLDHIEQQCLVDQIERTEATPSHAQAIQLRKLSQNSALCPSTVQAILSEEKPNQRAKIHLPYEQAKQFLPASLSQEKVNAYILTALQYYHRHQKRTQRDDR